MQVCCLVDGEIQIIPYANSMILTTSMSASSTEWKAIASDGTLVAPGTEGTLKWDAVSGKMQLTNGTITPTDQGQWLSYTTATLSSGLSRSSRVGKGSAALPGRA